MAIEDRDDFAIALADVTAGAAAFRPPRRVRVSEGAADALQIRQPGGYVGPWSADETPYMVEPMNMLASRRHEAVIFVGPARTGKTMALVDGWMAYAATCDPGDMLIVQMTQDKAREYSKTRIDRALRHSPKLTALASSSKQDDNTHDKQFRHGMWLRIGWPTVSQVSSSDYRYTASTDYDRVDDDIGGEGALFGLLLKRTQTFLSRGMTLVESSPGRELIDPNWHRRTPHEAPPTTGVLGLYNRGDRRRFYWPCPHCDEYHEAAPGLKLFNLPSDDELIEVVREADLDEFANDYNRIICPHCVRPIVPKAKHEMNLKGRWLVEGQGILADGRVYGDGVTSSIASYWLGGVSATYQNWKSLVMRHLQGLRDYSLSGSEETLKNTVNTDQGMPYMRRALAAAGQHARAIDERADKNLERFVVPEWARYLVATVDVQGGVNSRFSVQVHAIGPYREKTVIDRYEIKESLREGMGGKAPIDPAAYTEDWDLLTERVIRATYKTTEEGVELRIVKVIVDSGGEDGVTERAYAWWRRLRKEREHRRVRLYKGASAKGAPIVKESWVGSKNGRDQGDIPLLLCNPNLLKDAIDADRKRAEPGPGYIHMPSWLPKAWYDEWNAEVRLENGTWSQIRKRNETVDHWAMCQAGILNLGADKIRDWANPSASWARVLEDNSERMTREERQEMKGNARVETPVVETEVLRQPAKRIARRTAVSPYMT